MYRSSSQESSKTLFKTKHKKVADNILTRNNVSVMGDGEETIIFGHGFGSNQSSWRHVAAAFKDKYRIVLYDNTGSGSTDPQYFSQKRYNDINAYADDLLEITHALNLKKAIFVGHSVSGMIGILASIKAPGLFPTLVLLGASPRYLNDAAYMGGFEQQDLDKFYMAMEANYFAWVSGFASLAMTYPEKPELAQEFAATLASIRPDIAQSVSRVIFQSDFRDILSHVKAKTLVLQSTQDIAVPEAVGAYLQKHIKNSTMQIINATGHFPHISAPEEVIKAIKSFLAT